MKRKISLVLVFVIVLTIMAPLEVKAAVYVSSFTPRLSVPTASDTWMVKYNVSNNCTRYAYARISEILNRDATSLLGVRPGADGFPSLLQNAGYTASSTPKAGSVMCTSGHVAIVESVDTSSGYLIVSEGHSWTDMSGNSNLYNGICVVNGSGVLGYSTLTEGSRHGTWFDLRKIYYPNTTAKYYSLVSSSGGSTPTPSCSCSTSYAGNYVCIASGANVNIRSDHSTNSSIIGSIPPGATVYIGKANGSGDGYWGHVTYNGVNGYVYMKYFTKQVTSYTVSYNANGGSGAPGSSTHQSGSAHNVSSTVPTRFGYTFLGWSTSSSATSASYRYGSGFTVNSNVTLYAVWANYSYSSTNLGRGTKTIKIHTPGQCVYYALTLNSARTMLLESSGNVDSKVAIYNASGTELASNDDGGSSNNFKMEYTFNANTKYYIKFFAYGSGTGEYTSVIRMKYSVKYNANGGSGAPATQYKYYGDTLTLSSTKPTRSGYTFQGWGTSSSATSVSYSSGGSYSGNTHLNLYAVWKKNATQTAPATPTTSAVNATNGIKVSWNSVNGASKYVVFRRQGGSSTWVQVGTTTCTSYTDTSVTQGIYYIYSVRAYNSSGLYSAYNKAKTRTIQFIVAPYTNTTNVINGVKVSWSKVTGATNYAVYRRRGGSSTWYLVDYTKNTYLTDRDFDYDGTYYIYSVRAYNGSGYSAYNANKTKTIQPIDTPDVWAYSNLGPEVELEWDAVTGARKYNIYRKTDDSSWKLIKTTTNTYYYDYDDIEYEVDYYYAVRAVNGTGMSAYNNNKIDSVACYYGG